MGADLIVKVVTSQTEEASEDDATKLEITKDGGTWFVEVKATRIDDVRMTLAQARKAVEQGEHFLLCIVPVHSEDEPDLDDVKEKYAVRREP